MVTLSKKVKVSLVQLVKLATVKLLGKEFPSSMDFWVWDQWVSVE